MITLADYRETVGDEVLYEIYRRARKLHDQHVLHINSTHQGGGVAEILNSLVPLMNDAGVDAGWRTLHGSADFFMVTKKFHNALQGQEINFSEMKRRLYLETNRTFASYTHLEHACLIVHDPQPLPLVTCYRLKRPWIWRCHIDLSQPEPRLWSYLRGFLLRYDLVVVSSEEYRNAELPVRQRVIQPGIDPLTAKNAALDERTRRRFLDKFRVPLDKPLVTQVSRFDKWKDQLGVLDVWLQVREQVDCRLVLCGSTATDDPESLDVFESVRRRAKKHIDRGEVILLTVENGVLVNALQQASAVIVQKSLREGFGLTVTEALWKSRPVVASRVGGIPLQVRDGETGLLADPGDKDGFAERIVHLLRNPEEGAELGRRGREHVRSKFLITRVLADYLEMLIELLAG
ncbi:MAG TPA: glycosyltransferase [candidate division WOR-3 bacterium]|uniref:Glycosyltransferase n=1 Tax=candidate division WOR-3 bacterium TaxID=2052148 RepID=A0A7V0XFA1_UNCW3|nr:glycosyltransferase [candidate division WOR-3 bacterium]